MQLVGPLISAKARVAGEWSRTHRPEYIMHLPESLHLPLLITFACRIDIGIPQTHVKNVCVENYRPFIFRVVSDKR